MNHGLALMAGHYLSLRLHSFPYVELLLTIANFTMTVSLAACSYYFFERPFLRWKQAWSRTPSRPI